MPRVLVYTKTGQAQYTNPAYPGLAGDNADLDESVHLAIESDDGRFEALHSDTGVLFARADFTVDDPAGSTRTLVDPWLVRVGAQDFALLAVRKTKSAFQNEDGGTMLVYRTRDLLHYGEPEIVPLEPVHESEQVRRPRATWSEPDGCFLLEWDVVDADNIILRRGQGSSRLLREVHATRHNHPIDLSTLSPTTTDASWIAGNTIDLSDDEAELLRRHLAPIRHIGTRPSELRIARGDSLRSMDLPRVICDYSDGSTHSKQVQWDIEALSQIDTSVPGRHQISGAAQVHDFAFPFIREMISDPSICYYDGRFFLSTTHMNAVSLRVANSIQALRDATPINVLPIPNENEEPSNIWAQEMHIIHDVPYVFTTVGKRGWTSVQAVIVKCNGDPAEAGSWEQPKEVVRPDGSILAHGGISLDMTYFCVDAVHYVMWSGREILDSDPDNTVAGTANVYIATIDPSCPWQLTSEPQLIVTPEFGWDRCESPVQEGPYMIRRGNDIFVTLAAASTALPDLYCVGLLKARAGRNLLSVDEWTLTPYPVLTKESVPGEFGPGHNAFIKDSETGDDLLIYHAVPHDANGVSLGRRMGIRRVHWGSSGEPYLAMTPEDDLPTQKRTVTLDIIIE